MIANENFIAFAKFINFALSLWRYLKFYIRILDSFKFQKSQTHNPKGWQKTKKSVSDLPGNTKGGSITILLTSCLTGLESAV